MSTATLPPPSNLTARSVDRPMITLKDFFEKAKHQLSEVAPKHLSADRLMRVALMTISKTPNLAKCSPHSLLNAFMEASRLGLEIGGALGEAYLVPYGNQATFILGYRGMINLARRSGEIVSVEAHVVRESDQFDYEYGLELTFRHRPMSKADERITHAWALARFKGGGYQLDVMTLDEIEAVRSRSRASGSGPWVTDYAEMAKKTVVRRLCKYLPLSPEMRDGIETSDRAEFGDMIDGQVVEKPAKRPFGPPPSDEPEPQAPLDPPAAEQIIQDAAAEATAQNEKRNETQAASDPTAPTAPDLSSYEGFAAAMRKLAPTEDVYKSAMAMVQVNYAVVSKTKDRRTVYEAAEHGAFDWQTGKVVG